jgi:hypothetical protein
MRAKVLAWTLFAACVVLSVLAGYQNIVLGNQRHTIKQLMGFERGPHDTSCAVSEN